MERWQEHPERGCKDKDTEDFFSEDEERPSKERTAREVVSKAFCKLCPVHQACLEYALINDEVGVWGGTDTQQRRRMMRRGARKSCARCGEQQVKGSDKAQVCLACGTTWLM